MQTHTHTHTACTYVCSYVYIMYLQIFIPSTTKFYKCLLFNCNRHCNCFLFWSSRLCWRWQLHQHRIFLTICVHIHDYNNITMLTMEIINQPSLSFLSFFLLFTAMKIMNQQQQQQQQTDSKHKIMMRAMIPPLRPSSSSLSTMAE